MPGAFDHLIPGTKTPGSFDHLIPQETQPGSFDHLIPQEKTAGAFDHLIPKEAGFLQEGPMQVVGGARDALQQLLESTGTKQAMEEFAPVKEELFRGAGVEPPPQGPIGFPEVPEPTTGVGGAVRGISKFAATFVPMLGASKAIGLAGGISKAAQTLGAAPRIARGIGAVGAVETAAAAADVVAFGPFEERLSNLVESFPDLQNPITEYLAADKDDTEAEARFKQVLEGLSISGLVGAPILGIVRGVKRYKFGKEVDKALEDITFDPVTEAQERLSPEQGLPRDGEIPSPEDIITAPEDILKAPAVDFAGNIRLENIEGVEDIGRALTAVAETKGGFEEARRGIITHEETKALADTLGMTDADLLERKGGQAFNAEQALAARELLATSTDNLVELARTARGASNADLAEFQKAYIRHIAIQEQVSGITAEAGRALQAFRITAKSDKAKQKALENIISDAGGRDRLEHLADAIGELNDPDAIARYTRENFKATTSDKLLEAWINGLLSGPQTHAVNMMSNTLTGLWTIPEHFLAAGIGKVTKSGDRVAFREIPPRLAGYMEGAKEGLALAGRTFITEEPSHGVGKLEARRFQAIGSKKFREGKEGKDLFGVRVPLSGEIEVGGKQIRLPGRLLMASDEFFKSVGRRMELNGLAVRNATNEGLKGEELAQRIVELRRNPTEEMIQQARDFSETITFTKPLGSAGQTVQKLASTHPVARIIAPFIRTPVNIFKFAGARTPAALFSQKIRADIKKGGALRDLTLARIGMGSTTMAGVATLAAEGRITGGGPSDPTLRANLRNSGWQPYSAKIGDKYYSYSRLEPLGMTFGIAADFAEIAGEMDTAEADKVAAMIVMSASKNLVSKTYARGLTDLTLAFTDPDRYGERYIQKLAGTAIPTAAAQTARVVDPVLRDARSIIDSWKSRTPGYSKDLPPRRNVWGEPVLLTGGLGPDIISPIYTSSKRDDPVLDEVVRLKIALRLPAKKLDGIELSPEEYSGFVRDAGLPAKKILDQLVRTPDYRRAPDFLKRRLIKGIVEKNRNVARNILRARDPRFLKSKVQRMTE